MKHLFALGLMAIGLAAATPVVAQDVGIAGALRGVWVQGIRAA